MEKTIDVVGFGDPFQDLVIRLTQLPPTNVNMCMDDYCFQGGGNVSTAMVASARLGLKSAMIGNVGSDLLGRMILSDLQYDGVDTSHMTVHSGSRSNFCLCMAEQVNQGKEFISKAGDFAPLQIADLDKAFTQSAKVLHIGNFTPAIVQACQWIHEAGGKVSIDAAYYRPDIYENYRHIDIFIGSETYYNDMRGEMSCEEAMRSIQRQGPEVVIFTFGAEGCRGVTGDRYFELPAMKVEAIDSTGAGDVFHGAYIYAYLQGWPTEQCARFASGVSAIKCTRLGGRAGIPSLETVTKFLEEGIIDYTEIDGRALRYRHGF